MIIIVPEGGGCHTEGFAPKGMEFSADPWLRIIASKTVGDRGRTDTDGFYHVLPNILSLVCLPS